LNGEYCSNCGQRDIELLKFKKLIKDFFDHHLDLDSRIYRTIKYLIFNPGFLTIEYWGGRRKRFIPPFKIYLLTSFLYFFTYSVILNTEIENNEVNSSNLGIEKIETNNSIDFDDFSDRFDYYMDNYEKEIELFFFLPLTALGLLFLNKKLSHLYFSHHFIASIHLSSAWFILQTIIEILNKVFPHHTSYVESLNITLLIYCVLMIKNIYNNSLIWSFIKTILLMVMTLIMLFTAIIISLILILLGFHIL
jgi:hypothetical protein